MCTQSWSWIQWKKWNHVLARLTSRTRILLTIISTAVKLTKIQRPKWLSSNRSCCSKRFRLWACTTKRQKNNLKRLKQRMERFAHLFCTKNWTLKLLQASDTSKKCKIWLEGSKSLTTWVTTLHSCFQSCWIRNTGGSKILGWVSKTSTLKRNSNEMSRCWVNFSKTNHSDPSWILPNQRVQISFRWTSCSGKTISTVSTPTRLVTRSISSL